ncbi:squalene/phytoene synthase family protein [Streptomyces acidiscabies]|uniref:Squalene/phytoene synthase family protein n=2 Tax=Streptomyces acidiscabies TaxID=42234 RepID=A0AAP6EGJ4_9ACTN|nr:squalene/phytoene synthase family protein [Streptomyces acidiscabies]MBP5935068.1 phytoene/squalene synthetase [Streptomyces sp. LBUM 1476]MBZ3917145.1 squalene/phytoene synthase family protein [Streptomyces acidiscabies]MDX2961385.1 squalene/phytoene synthase family protein [Streptomyces acidiscabies]MDX3022743.1 squalene/phytoene synthase family protein [Streptomyces acidiscabies]MDX3792107.1 squalene/phytoene synthase family protein [Streptomyces acidiscabies]
MSTWKRSLDAAGVREPGLRRDYGEQRRTVARYRRASYVAVRLLLPAPALPHVLAATAFMHHSDGLLDTGPHAQRAAAWAEWERQVREALRTGTSSDAVLRALVHTVAARPRLRGVLETYLATATAELDFAGFTTEADYQAYVDAYTFPAFMLIATLVGPEEDDGDFRAACRTYIDGSQRLDFTNDLAEDLREGRPGIPSETLKRFSLTEDDLRAGHETDAIRELVTHEITRARADLDAAARLPHLAPAPYRPLLLALIDIELLTADAALARGAGLLKGSAEPSPAGALRVLLKSRLGRRSSGGQFARPT